MKNAVIKQHRYKTKQKRAPLSYKHDHLEHFIKITEEVPQQNHNGVLNESHQVIWNSPISCTLALQREKTKQVDANKGTSEQYISYWPFFKVIILLLAQQKVWKQQMDANDYENEVLEIRSKEN